MNEEKKENKQDVGIGNKSEEASLIERANVAAERLEAANKEMQSILERQEALKARETLGGKTAGAEQQKEPKEIDPREYAKQALSGQIPAK